MRERLHLTELGGAVRFDATFGLRESLAGTVAVFLKDDAVGVELPTSGR
jgi:hypothetical protein